MHQDIQCLASGRSHSRLGPGRRGEIARRIRCWLSSAIDPVKFLFGVTRKDEIVMQNVLVSPIEPEIKHHAGAGGLASPTRPESFGAAASDKFTHGPHTVHVGYRRCGGHTLPIVGLHRDNTPALVENPGYADAKTDLYA